MSLDPSEATKEQRYQEAQRVFTSWLFNLILEQQEEDAMRAIQESAAGDFEQREAHYHTLRVVRDLRGRFKRELINNGNTDG